MSNTHTPDGITIHAPVSNAFSRILTPEAMAFVGALSRQFDDRRRELMARRETVQADIDAAVEVVRSEGRGLYGLINNATHSVDVDIMSITEQILDDHRGFFPGFFDGRQRLLQGAARGDDRSRDQRTARSDDGNARRPQR